MAVHAIAVEPIPETSVAERAIADALAIGAPAAEAERVRDSVPLWFHTFALAPGVYTPGIARDHGYRLAVLAPCPKRAALNSLGLHEGKTRLIEFGRFAAENRKARGLPKPETFEFLGLTHVCAKDRRGARQAATGNEQEADAGKVARGQG